MLQPSWLAFILLETPCKILEKKDSHHSVTPVYQSSLGHTCLSVLKTTGSTILGGVHTGTISIDQPGMCVHWYTQDPPAWVVYALVHSGLTILGGVHNGTVRINHPEMCRTGTISINKPGKCVHWYSQK